MTVRAARPEDLVEIAALIRELAEYEHLADAVAWSDPEELRPHVFGADAVAGVLLETLRSMTGGRVEWSVLDRNEQAQRFYRTLGAAPVDGWTTWRSLQA